MLSDPGAPAPRVCFLVREGDVFVVAGTRRNANALMAFEFLKALVTTIKSYFGGVLNSDKVRLGYTLLYAVLDEAMDYGYPQILSYDLLKEYVLEKGACSVRHGCLLSS